MLISQFLKRIVLLIVCFYFTGLSASAKGIDLSKNSFPLDISSLVEYYETNDGTLTLHDIQHRPFITHTQKAIHFGFSDITSWFKITLYSSKTGNWSFECENPLIEYFDVFIPNGNKFDIKKGGCFVAKENRNYHYGSNHPIILFPLLANEPKTFYIKITSQRGFYTKFLVMPEKAQVIKSRSDDRRNWFFDGIQLFGNLLIGIIAFFLFKTNTYRVFAFYSFCISITVLGYHESLGDLFTSNPMLSSLINTFPYRLLVVPEIILTFYVLPITTQFPRWIKWYLYLIILATFILLFGICVDYNWKWVKMNVWNSVLAELTILLLFAYAYYKKIKLEGYFVCSFLFSFLGFLFLQLRLLQAIDFGWIHHIIFFAEMSKIVFFIFLVFHFFKRIQPEKIEAEMPILINTLPDFSVEGLGEKSDVDKEPSKKTKLDKVLKMTNGELVLNPTNDVFLQRIDEIIENKLSDSTFNIVDLADALNLSTVQLRRKLKTQTNQTTVEYIRNYRLKKAAELLKNRSGNISDVAFQVGFESLSYFTKVFQEFYGKSPSDWLKTH
ncbi:helix-turn-helix domain-containing protein [Arcicella sp. DC2W]|uniref:Helix-turn-helix domain-containing protein n=1 Tax=Arcicella gelida TaxID=2984195 RepID=A0ABU5S768_9BACT|nr:helix-turn-helix domain-containing protein [Arcicella sp. DC2W]MEA5404250.1 helix-turn-helix domain-containing protein [Arcicella sp. DC2W]